MHGVVETKEMLKAVMVLAKVLAGLAKDGIDLSDIGGLLANEELKSALSLAASGMKEIPEEIKDLDLAEGIELAMALAQELPSLIEALKK